MLSFARMGVAETTRRTRPTGQESVRTGPPGRRSTRGRRRGTLVALALASFDRQWRLGDPALPGLPSNNKTPGWLRAIRHHLFPLLAYLLITLAVTFPLVLHLGTHLPGDGRDAWQNVWNYWWLRQSLAAGQNPYQTDLLYAPYGVPLYLHTLNPFNGLLTLPVQLAFGLTAAYNAAILLSLTLAGYFAYLLIGVVSGSRTAGFIGGVIYAFGSYHLAHLLGHANLVASEWLPAYLLCLLLAPASTGARRWRWIGAGALALVFLALCDWQYALFAAIFTALWVGWTTIARRSVVPALTAGITGLLGIIPLLPLLIPTVRQLRDTAETRPEVPGPETFSADLISFVVPSPLQAWWGTAAERIGDRAIAEPVERAIFLGFAPLALALIGLWFGRRRAAFWAVAAAAFALLALGPVLQVAGNSFAAIPLPYRLLGQVPLANVFRVPARFGLLVTLCLAVLAGLAVVGLPRRFPAIASGRARLIAPSLLTLLLLAEHFPAPYPLVAVNEPSFYRQLATSSEQGAILELPFALTRSSSLYNQTIHGRPIIGGYLSRPLAYPILALPPFGGPTPDDIVAMPTDGVAEWVLHRAGVRWVVVLRELADRATGEFVARYVDPTPLYQDEQMTVYRPKAPGAARFYLQPTTGWHAPEDLADGRRMRWLPDAATLDTWSLSDAQQTGTLRFEAWSFNQPRRLQLSVDGQPVAEWLVAEPKPYEVPLTLAPGRHTITLRTLDPPERPAQTVGGEDTRLIAIGVTGIELR